MPFIKVPNPQLTDIETLSKDEEFVHMIQRRVDLLALKASIEEEIDELNSQIAPRLLSEGFKTIEAYGHTVSVVESEGRATLRKELLLRNGVTADQIANSTVQGDPYVSVRVAKIKKSDEGDGA